MPQLWIGLGNPGADYAGHRHNIGFMTLDALHARYGTGPWKARFSGMFAEARIDGSRLLMLKPQTFMNESGRAAAAAASFFKLAAPDVTVFYDELDLEPFRVKVKMGGGAAGHNGIRSLSAHLGPDFRRVRLGIGHPGHRDRVTPYVLGNFAKAEIDGRDFMLDRIVDAAP